MAKAYSEWRVLPHEQLQKATENLWWIRGSLPSMSLKRIMTIVRKADGQLVIHNAIALDEPNMQQIEAWGTPTVLVVPNGIHRLDAPAYKRRFPALRVFAPRGARKKVEEVVPVDDTYENFPGDPQVQMEPLQGVGDSEGVMVVRSGDGVTVVFSDAVFNMDRKRDPLGFLFTTALRSAPGPRVSWLAKVTMVKNKPALKDDLQRFARLPGLNRLVVAHEKVTEGGAASAALLKASEYL